MTTNNKTLLKEFFKFLFYVFLTLFIYFQFFNKGSKSRIIEYENKIDIITNTIDSLKSQINKKNDSIKILDLKLNDINDKIKDNKNTSNRIKNKKDEKIKKIINNDVDYSFDIINKHYDSISTNN